MDKLLENYEKEGAIKSNLANLIWKGGVILFSVLYIVFNYIGIKKYNLFIYILIVLFLCVLSEYIFLREVTKKIGFKVKIKLRNIKSIYKEIDKYQKKWIVNYCKNSKINSFDKLNIILQELKGKREKSNTKYINPVIIGTLLLSVWEIILQYLKESIGFENTLAVAFVLVVIISVVIGIIQKMNEEDKEFFARFEYYSSKERLESLIIHSMLKQ